MVGKHHLEKVRLVGVDHVGKPCPSSNTVLMRGIFIFMHSTGMWYEWLQIALAVVCFLSGWYIILFVAGKKILHDFRNSRADFTVRLPFLVVLPGLLALISMVIGLTKVCLVEARSDGSHQLTTLIDAMTVVTFASVPFVFSMLHLFPQHLLKPVQARMLAFTSYFPVGMGMMWTMACIVDYIFSHNAITTRQDIEAKLFMALSSFFLSLAAIAFLIVMKPVIKTPDNVDAATKTDDGHVAPESDETPLVAQ